MISTSISTSVPTGDFAFCEICSNYTPQVFVQSELESGCEYCWDAYGEIHQAFLVFWACRLDIPPNFCRAATRSSRKISL